MPVAFGVLTCENVEQAEARIERAAEARAARSRWPTLFAQLRAQAR